MSLYQRLYPPFFSSDIWVMSESNLICLSQIWVKKETKKARIYDISHFATKVRRCSESNLICLSQIWVKKAPQNARIRDISCFATKARCCSIRAWRKRIAIIPFLPYLAVTCFIPWKDWSLFQGHLYFKTKEYSLFLAKLTLLANDSDCLPKVCYLNLKKLRYLSKLR